MEIHDETRTLRRRLGGTQQVVAPGRAATGSPTVACRVVDGGAIPTTVPNQFLVKPLRLGGALAEAGAGMLMAGAKPFACVVLGGGPVPAVGVRLVARRCGGRWVAMPTYGTDSLCTATYPSFVTFDNGLAFRIECEGFPGGFVAAHFAGYFGSTYSGPGFFDPAGSGAIADFLPLRFTFSRDVSEVTVSFGDDSQSPLARGIVVPGPGPSDDDSPVTVTAYDVAGTPLDAVVETYTGADIAYKTVTLSAPGIRYVTCKSDGGGPPGPTRTGGGPNSLFWKVATARFPCVDVGGGECGCAGPPDHGDVTMTLPNFAGGPFTFTLAYDPVARVWGDPEGFNVNACGGLMGLVLDEEGHVTDTRTYPNPGSFTCSPWHAEWNNPFHADFYTGDE